MKTYIEPLAKKTAGKTGKPRPTDCNELLTQPCIEKEITKKDFEGFDSRVIMPFPGVLWL